MVWQPEILIPQAAMGSLQWSPTLLGFSTAWQPHTRTAGSQNKGKAEGPVLEFVRTRLKANLDSREGEMDSASWWGVVKRWRSPSNSFSSALICGSDAYHEDTGTVPGAHHSMPFCWFMSPFLYAKESFANSLLIQERVLGTGSVERLQPGCSCQM